MLIFHTFLELISSNGLKTTDTDKGNVRRVNTFCYRNLFVYILFTNDIAYFNHIHLQKTRPR